MRFVLHALQLSSGFAPYPHFVRRGYPAAARFLLKLLFFLAVLVVAGMLPRLLPLSDQAARWLGQVLPDAAIQDGELRTAATLPYAVTNRSMVVRLDLDGALPQLSPELPGALVFARDRLLFGVYSGQPQAPPAASDMPYHGLPEGKLDGAYFRELFRRLIYQAAPLAAISLFAVGAMSLLLLSFSFTAVTAIADRLVGRRDLTFAEMLSIATYALAPPSLMMAGYALLGLWQIPFGFVFFALYAVFLIGGAYTCRRDLGPMPGATGGGDPDDQTAP